MLNGFLKPDLLLQEGCPPYMKTIGGPEQNVALVSFIPFGTCLPLFPIIPVQLTDCASPASWPIRLLEPDSTPDKLTGSDGWLGTAVLLSCCSVHTRVKCQQFLFYVGFSTLAGRGRVCSCLLQRKSRNSSSPCASVIGSACLTVTLTAVEYQV